MIRIRDDDAQRVSFGMGLADAKTAERSVEARYQVGLTDYGDVLLARRAVLADQDGLASAEGQQRRDLVSLYKALGGGWQSCCRSKFQKRGMRRPLIPFPRTEGVSGSGVGSRKIEIAARLSPETLRKSASLRNRN